MEDYKVTDTITAYYIKNFITEEEENLLLKCIEKLDIDRWVQLKSGRSLKKFGGEVSTDGLIDPEPLPIYFDCIAKFLSEKGIFPEHIPNHVLLNKYKPGDGIMPH